MPENFILDTLTFFIGNIYGYTIWGFLVLCLGICDLGNCDNTKSYSITNFEGHVRPGTLHNIWCYHLTLLFSIQLVRKNLENLLPRARRVAPAVFYNTLTPIVSYFNKN
jgi:hypothetical protein